MGLHSCRPDARLTLLDPNPAQHTLIEAKVRARVDRAPPATFNVGDDDRSGLSECGNFEGLFRQLRGFLHEFVAPRDVVQAAASGAAEAQLQLTTSPYWPVAFELFFSNAMLTTMFGPAAVQHATPGSYPRYFQRAFEALLRSDDAASNPFVQHLFCGCFYDNALPLYLRTPLVGVPRFEHLIATLDAVVDFGVYDLVHLSNVLDWTDPPEVQRLAGRIAAELRPGASITLRQLNNDMPLEPHFPGFTLVPPPGNYEASGFYKRVLIGVKT